MHAEIKIDDSIIMIADAIDSYSANNLLLHVNVPDVQSTFKKAIEFGCVSLEELSKKGRSKHTRSI